ncbi:AAA family ATPase [Chromohalobacter sp.]|uniref:AAA family ATPase n=1 Tax=Chromohalobacter sp. TaxID=50740 RepID=UPI003242FF0B
MKITIEDFGPVSRFEFDTDVDFHLIVGENNVGKSYALSAFYSVLKAMDSVSHNPSFMHYFSGLFWGDAESEAMKDKPELNTRPKEDYDVQSYFEFVAKVVFDESFAQVFSENVKATYSEISSISNQFSGGRSRITISSGDFFIVLSGDIDGFEVEKVSYAKRVIVRPVKTNRTPRYQGEKYVVYLNKAVRSSDIYSEVNQACAKQLLKFFGDVGRKISAVHYLPASRSGLYQALSAFGQIIAQLSQSRSMLTQKVELPGISQQLSDYFIKLSNIVVSNEAKNKSMEGIAAAIEKEVLKGDIEFDESDKRIYYKPVNTDLKLDLSVTSSMVSEVAPIVAYIRHILSNPPTNFFSRRFRSQKNRPPLRQVIIIEEPEAHLHPRNQIKMTKLYSELAKAGVVVVMTSHSNYVFNKLSNIVISGGLDTDQVKCDLFSMTGYGGVGEPQGIDRLGIDDQNFVDAGEALLEEKLDLFSKMENSND